MTRIRDWLVGGVLLCRSRVLLCRRRADRSFYPAVWDLPGGHVEPGEDDMAALARECREEVGITVASSQAVALVEPSPGLTFSVRLIAGWRGEPRNAAPEEHDRIGWFDRDQLAWLPLADQRYLPLLRALMAASGPVEVRRIEGDSWDDVGALHALSQQETYAGLLPPASTVRFRPKVLAEEWRSRATTVVLHGGWSDQTLLGFAAISSVSARCYELTALHVRPDWHGRGLADWLHRAALAHVQECGGEEISLWVVEGNARARRFYHKQGWCRTGERRTVLLGGMPLPALAYTRRVG